MYVVVRNFFLLLLKTVLPGPAWLLLNKICIPLFRALYSVYLRICGDAPEPEGDPADRLDEEGVRPAEVALGRQPDDPQHQFVGQRVEGGGGRGRRRRHATATRRTRR